MKTISLLLRSDMHFEMISQLIGGWRKVMYLPPSPGEWPQQQRVTGFLPTYAPEPYLHFAIGDVRFMVRRSGAPERIPAAHLSPKTVRELQARSAEFERDEAGNFIMALHRFPRHWPEHPAAEYAGRQLSRMTTVEPAAAAADDQATAGPPAPALEPIP